MVARFKSGLLEDTQMAGQFSQVLDTTTALTFGIRGGFFTLNDRLEELSDTTLALTDDETNFVYIDWSVTPAVMATRLTDFPSNEYTPCFVVVTVSGVITSIEDWRTRVISVNDVEV